jgi:hypothetical protein
MGYILNNANNKILELEKINETLPTQINNTYFNAYQEGYARGVLDWNNELYNSVYSNNQFMFIDNQGYIKLINIEGFCQE